MTGRIAEDARDGSAHDKVWEKRGKVTTRLRNVVREIDTDVGAIVEGRRTSSSSSRGTTAPRARRRAVS